MAKLSDFQKPAIPVSIAVDANVMDRNAKASASRTDWRNTKITEQGGAIESDPFRNIPLFASLHDRRTRMHDALDRVIDDVEDEAESSSNEEPEEPSESFDAEMASMHRRLRALLHGSDALDVVKDVRSDRERQRFVTADTHAAHVIAPRREVRANSGYVTDAAFIAQHLDPNMLCVEAENNLRDISFKRQADDANRGYWSGLFYFLKSQPQGSRIRDIENKACLSSLLMRTVGGMHGAFGV